MAVIYLKHPVFGAKVACMDMEASADEKNGWVRYTPSEPEVAAEKAPVDAEVPNFLAAPRSKAKPKTEE